MRNIGIKFNNGCSCPLKFIATGGARKSSCVQLTGAQILSQITEHFHKIIMGIMEQGIGLKP
jgi:aromatic ring-opening dioxygenase LigB subunit